MNPSNETSYWGTFLSHIILVFTFFPKFKYIEIQLFNYFRWSQGQKQPPELFFIKKLFFKNVQYSQEKTCVGVSF